MTHKLETPFPFQMFDNPDGYRETEVFDFRQLSLSGVLWSINRHVFHPRGLAMAVHHDGEGNATGWSLWQADEPWTFDSETDDLGFRRFEDTIARATDPAPVDDSDALPKAFEVRVSRVREFIDQEYPCHCHEGYKGRGLVDPQCKGCEFREDALALVRISAGLDPFTY